MAEYNKARRELNRAIKESKRRCWKELVAEVKKDPWGRPYKVIMTHLKCQPMPSPTCPQLLEKIATALFPQQLVFTYKLEQLNPKDISTITLDELIEADNIALKSILRATPTLFLDVYDTCLREGTFPQKWKEQRLVLLPRGKKPPDEPSSYRPLCMLDTAGKILERIIYQRIEAVVDPILAENQFGFRKGRSTLDAIKVVVDIAKDAIAGTRWKGGKKKYCLVAALDIKNAFNSANWNCVIRALEEKNVPGYLRRIVASYFTNRVLKYDTKNGPEVYEITGGVPQGSVLGTLLWNIMYDCLLRTALPTGVKLVTYADDVAVVIVAKHLEETEIAFDIIFRRVNLWMDMVNLQLAKHKTEAGLITNRKTVETIKL